MLQPNMKRLSYMILPAFVLGVCMFLVIPVGTAEIITYSAPGDLFGSPPADTIYVDRYAPFSPLTIPIAVLPGAQPAIASSGPSLIPKEDPVLQGLSVQFPLQLPHEDDRFPLAVPSECLPMTSHDQMGLILGEMATPGIRIPLFPTGDLPLTTPEPFSPVTGDFIDSSPATRNPDSSTGNNYADGKPDGYQISDQDAIRIAMEHLGISDLTMLSIKPGWDAGHQASVWFVGVHGTTAPGHETEDAGGILSIDAMTGAVYEVHPCR